MSLLLSSVAPPGDGVRLDIKRFLVARIWGGVERVVVAVALNAFTVAGIEGRVK